MIAPLFPRHLECSRRSLETALLEPNAGLETEPNAAESHIPDDPLAASRYFLDFIRELLKKAAESL